MVYGAIIILALVQQDIDFWFRTVNILSSADSTAPF